MSKLIIRASLLMFMCAAISAQAPNKTDAADAVAQQVSIRPEIAKYLHEPQAPIKKPVTTIQLTAANQDIVQQMVDMISAVNDHVVHRTHDDQFVAQEVQSIIDHMTRTISSYDIARLITTAQYYDVKFLVNALVRVLVLRSVRHAPTISLAELLASLTSAGIKGADMYIKKHFKLSKAHYEMSVADYIAIYGQPQLDGDHFLNLSHAGITSLRGIENIANASSVATLDLSYNAILDSTFDPDFPTRPFLPFTSTSKLDVSYNNFTTFPENVFDDLGNTLKELDLSENDIVMLPENIFKDLRKLEELDLSENFLSDIKPDMFRLPNIKKIDLSGNELSSSTKAQLKRYAPGVEIEA